MRITVKVCNARHAARVPYEHADHVLVNVACPHCAHAPLAIRGGGIRRRDHDSYYAEGRSLCCDQPIGTIRVQMSTIFGIEEDERVLGGPWRVYSRLSPF